MARFACLLRAVNVTGKRKIKMQELREMCVGLGYTDVETYLQSGNIVLNTSASRTKVAAAISTAIGEAFGHDDVGVFVRSAKDLEKLIACNPHVGAGHELSKLHATFVEPKPAPTKVKAIDAGAFVPDEFALGSGVIYVHCPNGYGRTKLNNNFFERKLSVRATTRNWKTVNALLDMCVAGG